LTRTDIARAMPSLVISLNCFLCDDTPLDYEIVVRHR
jgi:hypothetical protein